MGHQKNRFRKNGTQPSDKISETITTFAEPLCAAVNGPRTIDDLRAMMGVAAACWNVPVLATAQDDDLRELKERYDAVLYGLPEPLTRIIDEMLADRARTLSEMPFIAMVEVRGETLDDARVYAEARQLA